MSQFLYADIIKEILNAIYLFPLRCMIQYPKYLSLILTMTLVQTVFYLAFLHALQIFAERQTCCSVAKLSPTLWNPKDCNTPGFPVFPSPSPRVYSLSRRSQWHPISHPASPLLFLPLTFSSIRVFSNESALHIRCPNYWSFSVSPCSKYEGWISFRIDWFDLLTVQRTLKDLLQHYSSKASILWHSVFFVVQLSHPYMTTGKTIVLTIQTFVSKVLSLSVFVIYFLPRSNWRLISWL